MAGAQLEMGLPPPSEMGFGEAWARSRGHRRICGVDEVGRGPLAGPVVAAAVCLPHELETRLAADGLTDSKKLAARKRERFAERIEAEAFFGVGEIGPERIDAINILEATFEAMRAAVAALVDAMDGELPDCLLVDGNRPIVPSPLPQAAQKTLVGGDGRAVCIAAASVVAKVRRDAMMVRYDEVFPGYGFAGHKGYPSASHREAIVRLGPCPIHRRSFRGVLPELESDDAKGRGR